MSDESKAEVTDAFLEAADIEARTEISIGTSGGNATSKSLDYVLAVVSYFGFERCVTIVGQAIDELERLQADNARLRAEVDSLIGVKRDAAGFIRHLQSEVERLTQFESDAMAYRDLMGLERDADEKGARL